MERFFVRRPIFAIVLSIVIVLLGVISLKSLPVEQYPDITPPVVEISATYPGADALAVNDAVGVPIAQNVMGVEDMLYMQTTSANDGTMSLQVVFGIDSDPDIDQILTQNRVTSATPLLPQAVTQQGVTTEKVSTGFLLVFSLWSDGRYDNRFLANYAYINIQNELLKIDGVGKVNIMGAGPYSMRIWIRPDVLDYYNISIDDIIAAVESQSGIFPAGKLGEQPLGEPVQFTYTVTMPPEIDTPEQYGDILVKTLSDGQQIHLRDVARIDLGSQSYGVTADFGGRPGAMVSVYQTPGSNAVEVGGKVKEAMKTLSEKFLDGIEYDTVVDTTSSIEAGIREIFSTLVFALLLVILIIYIFLQDWRATLIPLIAIPVSIVGAFMLFPLLGFTVNIISLLGLVLAIGLVVDDAIVVVEAVQVNIERGMDSRRATLDAMRSVASPIVATTVVLLSVFIPVSFIGGVSGKLFQQFSIGIAVSVTISAFNALTLSPALCSILLRHKPRATHGFFGAFNRWFDKRMQGYMKSSAGVMRHSALVLAVIAVLGGAIWGITRLVPAGFLPTEDQGYLMVVVNLPQAASVTRTEQSLEQAQKLVAGRDDIQFVASAAGFDMLSGIASSNSGIMFITLKSFKDRKLSAGQIAEELNEQLNFAVPDAVFYALEPPSIPGLGLTSGISMMLQDLQGKGIGYLAEQSNAFLAEASKLPSVASATTQFNASVPQRRLRIDRDRAEQEGVSLAELHRLVSTYLGGTYINNFNRFGKLYQTYIQADAQYRRDKSDLGLYYIGTSSGNSVPVTNFVSAVDTTGVEYITQFNLYNSIPITVTPKTGYSTGQGMADLERLASERLPKDVGIAWSGVSYQEANASGNGSATYLMAFVFVFLALAALYNSWTLPFSVLLGVPLAIFGALLFIMLAHFVNPAYIDNVYTEISLIMLIGLSAKNAILVVEYADRQFFGEGKTLEQAAIGAARLRVRPILMTAFAFIIGVLPLVFASGAYSTARNIMGVALVGGMGVATLLGIFVYPALYYIVGRISRFDRKRERDAAIDKLLAEDAAAEAAGSAGNQENPSGNGYRIAAPADSGAWVSTETEETGGQKPDDGKETNGSEENKKR